MAFYNFMGGGGTKLTWTASKMSPAAMAELPYIELYEYTQTYSALAAQIERWMTSLDPDDTGVIVDPYADLYIAKPTGNVYRLPFFNDYHHTISQGWGEYAGAGANSLAAITKFAETVVKMAAPAGAIVRPQSYEGANETTYDVTFDLLNTVGDNNEEIVNNINNNRLFIERFTHQNLHDLGAVFVVQPPCLYSAYIPGIRWSPAAIISNLQITNKGSINASKSLKGMLPWIDPHANSEYIIPDAWGVTFTVKELINETKKIFRDGLTPKGDIKVSILPSEDGFATPWTPTDPAVEVTDET